MRQSLLLPLAMLFAPAVLTPDVAAARRKPVFRHVSSSVKSDKAAAAEAADSALLRVREVSEIMDSISLPPRKDWEVSLVSAPWIFSGYRQILRKGFSVPEKISMKGMSIGTNDSTEVLSGEMIMQAIMGNGSHGGDMSAAAEEEVIEDPMSRYHIDVTGDDATPEWLRQALTSERIQQDFIYNMMIANPSTIDVAYWDLPVPPRLPEEDKSYAAYIRKLDLPDVDIKKAVIPENEIQKKHWLHNFNTGLQFSQAYISPNWYQGGNNHISGLFNFLWNVTLNPVYHPTFLFQSNLQYKLGIYSTPDDEVHEYAISEDVLQYNLNIGLKAVKNWYYSYNLTFKTQVLSNYESNSTVKKASFLSPGELNMGLGMTYSKQNDTKTLKLNVLISPISYNLKTCIDSAINPEQFNIKPGHKSVSEIGSNTEANVNWNITSNINLKSRLFLFTDYSYFQGDWENTFSFAINRFLSTQIYLHMRFDSSVDSSTGWKKFMLKEILSFGLSYNFSTKP